MSDGIMLQVNKGCVACNYNAANHGKLFTENESLRNELDALRYSNSALLLLAEEIGLQVDIVLKAVTEIVANSQSAGIPGALAREALQKINVRVSNSESEPDHEPG